MLQLTLLLSLLTSAVVGQEFHQMCFNPFPFQHIRNPDGFYSLNFTANDDVSLLVYPLWIQNTNIPLETAMIPYDHDVNSGRNGTSRLCLKEDADCAISDIGKFHVEWNEDTPDKGGHAGDSSVQRGKQDLERLRAKQKKEAINIFLKAGEKAVYELPKYDKYCFVYYDYNNKWRELVKQGLPQAIEYEFYKSLSGLSYEDYSAMMSSIASVVISIGLGLYIRYYVTSKASKAINERSLVPFEVFKRLLTLDAVNKTIIFVSLLYTYSHDVRPASIGEFALHLLHSIGIVIKVLRFNLIYQFVAFNKPDIFKFNDASKHKITLMTFALMLFSRFIGIHGIFHSSTFSNFINSKLLQSFLKVSFGLQCYWKSQITEHTIVNDLKKYARCFKISRIVLIPLIPALKIVGFVLTVVIYRWDFDEATVYKEDFIEDTNHPLMHLFYCSLEVTVMCLANLKLFFYPIVVTISLKIWGSSLIEDTSVDSIEMNHILSDVAQ